MAPRVRGAAASLACFVGLVPAALGVDILGEIKCSKNCHGKNECAGLCAGQQTQTRHCADQPVCKSAQHTQCPEGVTATHCQLSTWTEWQAIGCTGLCQRKRAVAKPNICGGMPCQGALSDTKSCPGMCQKQDCQMSPWGDWSDCGAKSENQRERSRDVVKSADEGAACFEALTETQVCGHKVREAVDCELSDWMEWGACTKLCDGGQRTRMRTIMKKALDGGKNCKDTLSETHPCGEGPCVFPHAQNCTFSEWSAWSSCTQEGAMQRTRRRALIVPPTIGGEICEEPLEQLEPCNPEDVVAPQPVDCKLGDWGPWSLCDKQCGGGQTYRSRSVSQPAQHGGTLCLGDLQETIACNVMDCGLVHGTPCRVSEWSMWGACSATCGTAQQTRVRRVLEEASSGGLGCNQSLAEAQGCGLAACAVQDCVWGDWSPWTTCPVTCGGANMTRTRGILVQPTPAGKLCDAVNKTEMKPCGLDRCNPPPACVDGIWSQWGSWSDCSKTCAGGFRSKSRTVQEPGSGCGTPASGLALVTEQCNVGVPCVADIDCTVSLWSMWGACSNPCDGVRQRIRNVTAGPSGNGKPCGQMSLAEVESCGGPGSAGCKDELPKDCTIGPWSAWGDCSVTCEGGHQTRTRDPIAPAANGGTPCQASLVEMQGCNLQQCGAAVDCQWGHWSPWVNCSAETGQQYRTRALEKLPIFGGEECKAESAKETQACTRAKDPTLHYCIWSDWSAYSSCSASCGNGVEGRTRTLKFVDDAPSDQVFSLATTSEECLANNTEVRPCTVRPCLGCVPQNCSLSAWTDWGEPSCEGVCTRFRTVTTPNNECGEPCRGWLRQTKACQANCDDKDCELTSWSNWTTCESEASQVYSTRGIRIMPQYDGEGCYGELKVTKSCVTGAMAAQDCVMSIWSQWGSCDKTCGGGQRVRVRTITKEAANMGRPCESPLMMVAPCAVMECPANPNDEKNCQLSEWSQWTVCEGLHMQQVYRRRSVVHDALEGGKACQGPLVETKQCQPEGLKPKNCEFATWSSWSACSATCNGGQSSRSRAIQQHAEANGVQCVGPMLQSAPCGMAPCSTTEDCAMSPWSDWSSCSATCGKGSFTRVRVVAKAADTGGKPCVDSLREVAECLAPAQCPQVVDCKWNMWSQWSGCVKASGTCGIGFKWRNRGLLSEPQNGGELCVPRISEEVAPVEHCQGQPKCCIDGQWADWNAWGSCSATCGVGTKKRTRDLAVQETWCGTPAEGSGTGFARCEAKACPGDVDCKFSEWSASTECSATCHGHTRRTRFIEANATGSGQPCQGETEVWEPCNPAQGQPEPPACKAATVENQAMPCLVSDWTEWTACSATCNTGFRTRERSVQAEPQFGGAGCPRDMQVVEPCNPSIPCYPSVVNCQWLDWTAWSACNVANGTMSRSRGFKVHEANGGEPCQGPMVEVTSCGDTCADDTYYCMWNEWEPWSDCSASCGMDAVKTRKRHMMVSARPSKDGLVGTVLPAPKKAPALKVVSDAAVVDRQRVLPENDGARPQELFGAFALGCLTLVAVFGGGRLVSSRMRGHTFNRLPLELPEYHVVRESAE